MSTNPHVDPASAPDAARALAHHGVQWPSRAARANLVARADDSHSALVWDATVGALVTEPFGADDARRVAYAFDDHALLWLHGSRVLDRHPIVAEEAATRWLDERLVAANCAAASRVVLPYVLDPPPVGHGYASATARRTLGALYASAHEMLSAIRASLSDLTPGPSPVRCWPHHFDIATLVSLDTSGDESARSVGVGMSPGDDAIAEPYAYVTPWPAPPPSRRGEAPPPFRWHTDGFVSLVVPFTDASEERFRDAFAIARASLSESP